MTSRFFFQGLPFLRLSNDINPFLKLWKSYVVNIQKISSKLRNFCFCWRFYLFSIISSSKYGLVALEMVSGSWSDKTIDLRLDLPDLDSYRNLTSSSSDDATLRAAANFNFFDRSSDFRVKLNLFLILKGFFEGIFWVSKVGRGRIHHQLNIISHIVRA